MKKQSLLSILIIFFALSSLAQNTGSLKQFKTAGGLIGYGPTFSDNVKYRVYYFAGDFSWSFKKPRKKDFVSLYFEPQFNLVRTERPWDIEFGANLGLRNYVKINEGFYFYQSLGSGPHFITAELNRQAKGFIFSDNLFLGALTRLKGEIFLNTQIGIRHISNAGLKLPNKGVNCYTFRIGISRRK